MTLKEVFSISFPENAKRAGILEKRKLSLDLKFAKTRLIQRRSKSGKNNEALC